METTKLVVSLTQDSMKYQYSLIKEMTPSSRYWMGDFSHRYSRPLPFTISCNRVGWTVREVYTCIKGNSHLVLVFMQRVVNSTTGKPNDVFKTYLQKGLSCFKMLTLNSVNYFLWQNVTHYNKRIVSQIFTFDIL